MFESNFNQLKIKLKDKITFADELERITAVAQAGPAAVARVLLLRMLRRMESRRMMDRQSRQVVVVSHGTETGRRAGTGRPLAALTGKALGAVGAGVFRAVGYASAARAAGRVFLDGSGRR